MSKTLKTYYNEIDPFCTKWLLNLIEAGEIAPGTVDERDIWDVTPTDLDGHDRCHFFAGIAGWDYALRLAGWPEDLPVWTGSCPCQPFSAAGKRGKGSDERHLWPAWFHLIRVCRPPIIFGEQVASNDGLKWLDLVCSDLEAEGYAVGAADLCAAGVGAPHIRQRLWFVALAQDSPRLRRGGRGDGDKAGNQGALQAEGRGASEMPVRVSCTFTWDRQEALRLGRGWSHFYYDVQVGGPAFDDKGAEFVPGRFIKEGVTFTSRGCPFSCPWCFVPAREGNIRELPIMPGHIVQDNNLLACSEEHITAVFNMLANQDKPIKFSGGLDSKLIQRHHVDLLETIKIDEMWFSCDYPDSLQSLEKVANLLHKFPRNKKRCYVLIGFNGEGPDDCVLRLQRVYELGFDPFAQLYKPMFGNGQRGRIWQDLARKWSRPAIYRTIMEKP